MAFKAVLMISGIVISFLIYALLRDLDYFSTVSFHHFQRCERLEIDLSTEDLVAYGDYLIGASTDSFSLYYKHMSSSTAYPGYLIAINPKTKEVYNITTHNFPSNIQMNAHGMTLYKNSTLYVISHSYDKGGEMVILFKLESKEKIEAHYIKHIKLENSNGIYNAIAVYNPQYFFLTQWLPFTDTPYGRDLSFFTSIYRSSLSFYTKSTGVKLCMVLSDTAIFDTKVKGYISNGIILHDNILYVADSASKSIELYSVSGNLEFNYLSSVKFTHLIDNIHYHKGYIYATGISRKVDYIAFINNAKNNRPWNIVPGGVSRLSLTSKSWKPEELIIQDKLNFPSTSAIVNDKMVISSVVDSALLICPFTP